MLWQRVQDLSITDPHVTARWLAAALVAVAGLLLLHRRVSWRTWVVFWTAVVLLHAAAPIQTVPLHVVIEAVFAVSPLILWLIRRTLATHFEKASAIDGGRYALPTAWLTGSVAGRAPPHR